MSKVKDQVKGQEVRVSPGERSETRQVKGQRSKTTFNATQAMSASLAGTPLCRI